MLSINYYWNNIQTQTQKNMNDIIEAFIHDHLFLHLVLIAVSMTAIIVAMGIDFRQSSAANFVPRKSIK